MKQMTAYDYGHRRGLDSGDYDGCYGITYNGRSVHAASDDEHRGFTDGYKIGYAQGQADAMEYAA